jgi:hypothetical protein
MTTFSGSYDPADVTFLLKPVDVPDTPVGEKERLIQSGARHYSEMITRERRPSAEYLRVFRTGLDREKPRLARDLLALAGLVAARRPGPVTVVSLARAGTPIGVLLTRTLRQHYGRSVEHYSVSIIRDRGIDEVALKYILARHEPSSVVFVDGWTGKGVIAAELDQAVRKFNASNDVDLDAGLFAVADLSGTAAASATTDDYLIPSCVLGATVSGLVSRSILNADVVGPGDFHGCLYYREFEPDDLSRLFVNEMSREIARQWETNESVRPCLTVGGVGQVTNLSYAALRERSTNFIAAMQARFGVRDVNYVKPGIGEATRVLLRRVPDRLLVRATTDPGVAHLLVLATEKDVPVETDPNLPYRAAALIRGMDQ